MAGFWILIQRAVGSYRRLQSDGARSVQSRPGVREERVWSGPLWVVGMACCSAARKGGGFLGSMAPPRNLGSCPPAAPSPQVVEIVKRLESRQRGWEEEDPGAEGGHCVQRYRPSSAELGRSPPTGWRQPGGPGRASWWVLGQPTPTFPGLLCSWVPCGPASPQE